MLLGSGLYYLRARYYDPATGQFISRDPMVSTTREPYAYVGDNPLNATDPTGLLSWDDVKHVGGSIAGGIATGVGAARDAVVGFGTTHTVGVCIVGSAGVVVGVTGSVCVHANLQSVGVSGTIGGGLDLPGGADLSVGPMFSDAHRVSELGDVFTYAGASGGEGITANAEFGSGTLSCGRDVHYGFGGPGIGTQVPIPISVWAGSSYTWTKSLDWKL